MIKIIIIIKHVQHTCCIRLNSWQAGISFNGYLKCYWQRTDILPLAMLPKPWLARFVVLGENTTTYISYICYLVSWFLIPSIHILYKNNFYGKSFEKKNEIKKIPCIVKWWIKLPILYDFFHSLFWSHCLVTPVLCLCPFLSTENSTAFFSPISWPIDLCDPNIWPSTSNLPPCSLDLPSCPNPNFWSYPNWLNPQPSSSISWSIDLCDPNVWPSTSNLSPCSLDLSSCPNPNFWSYPKWLNP